MTHDSSKTETNSAKALGQYQSTRAQEIQSGWQKSRPDFQDRELVRDKVTAREVICQPGKTEHLTSKFSMKLSGFELRAIQIRSRKKAHPSEQVFAIM